VSDDRSTFETTRARLEDIVVQVRRKDVSLEQSLDMLEEAVRLVNQCNDLIDQTSFRAPVAPAEGGEAGEGAEAADAVAPGTVAPRAVGDMPASRAADTTDGDAEGEDASLEAVAVVETFELIDLDGSDIASIEFVEFADEAGGEVSVIEIEDDERS
jgi:exodeoxyribonuclease VII small subunit